MPILIWGIFISSRNGMKMHCYCSKKALEVLPENVHMHHSLANIYRDSGQYEKALSEYEKVLEIEPSHRFALWDIGVAYEKMGMKDKAEERFKYYHEMTDCSFRRFWNCFD